MPSIIEKFLPGFISATFIYAEHDKPERLSECNQWADTTIRVTIWIDSHFGNPITNRPAPQQGIITLLNRLENPKEIPTPADLSVWF